MTVKRLNQISSNIMQELLKTDCIRPADVVLTVEEPSTLNGSMKENAPYFKKLKEALDGHISERQYNDLFAYEFGVNQKEMEELRNIKLLEDPAFI